MYPFLVDSSEKKFKPGDIIGKGEEVKIATKSSGILNFKDYGYTKKDLILTTISRIHPGEPMVLSTNENSTINDFKAGDVKTANMEYEAGIKALKVFASTGHASYNLPKVGKDFVKLFLDKKGAIKITNVIIHKISKDKFIPKLDQNMSVITRPVFKKIITKK